MTTDTSIAAPQVAGEVARFKKNARETVVATLSEFKGYPFADLRAYTEGADGQLVPTKKGLAVHPGALPDLLKLVQALATAASARA